MTAPRVCTVALNWNQPALTAECGRHLAAQTFPGGNAVVVVDNGSTAANLAALGPGLPSGTAVIRNSRNLGFAGGMNVGIRHALGTGCEFVWLLNNDAFPAPDCLARLVEALDADPALGAVTPALTYPDGRPQPAASRLDWETGEYDPVADPLPCPTPPGVTLVGTAPLVRADVLRRVGGFDPRFFAYREEDDLFARVAGGWKLGGVPAAACVHMERASTGGGRSPFAERLLARNTWLLLRKHAPVRAWPRLFLRVLAGRLLYAGGSQAAGREPVARAVVAGVWDATLGRFGRPGAGRPPAAVERFLLNHYWGLARGLWRAANAIAPAGCRRPFRGAAA